MSQEAVMIAVDNSDFMRNGDFAPSRLQAQNDAVNLLCQVKRQANPENTVGLISLANTEVLCTLTSDMSKIYNRLHLIQPKGGISFCTSMRIAHLALRHRQLRHQKMRIVCFIGSPIKDDEAEMVKLAKRLKKEKVNVDIVNFGEDEVNQKKLLEFVETINGKDGTGSHLVTVPPGTVLHESLASSPIIAGEDGSGALPGSGIGLEFGLDAVDDPDLIYALRVSMEDQRMRQEQEASANSGGQATAVLPGAAGTSEEELLRQALAMSMQVGPASSSGASGPVDLANMTEEEQIAYAIQMSMQTQEQERALEDKKSDSNKNDDNGNNNAKMDVDEAPASAGVPAASTSEAASHGHHQLSGGGERAKAKDEAVMDCDPEFLQSVLQYLPGVDPQNEEVRRAIESLTTGFKSDQGASKETSEEKKDGDESSDIDKDE
ncbi:26S proteasome non-ATPase regulatory subunit 4 [Echinococcus granulosus]|uniref:26S proteasome non-ATPase regulatory subunit 4 n=1 Tax=Echinococcus granulosus TaxID=6210 RepID=W6USR5_ECHGR|nr:26S proteasome non-ATPase regulatory subunit 4 [Echinococcus granulosus]EUB56439.1 26S proteasome non-ATPase regulatory subunit 4 [Echinococcus granulosus]